MVDSAGSLSVGLKRLLGDLPQDRSARDVMVNTGFRVSHPGFETHPYRDNSCLNIP
jgi:hypothetical protein